MMNCGVWGGVFFKGVDFYKLIGKYWVWIKIEGKLIVIGFFEIEY